MIDKQRIKTFVLGGAIGALVGIVIAPRSGKELRGSIADRAGEARDRSRENYFETQERLRERLAEMGDGEMRRPTNPEEASLGTSGAETPVQEPASEPDPGAQRPRFQGLRDVSRERREVESAAQPEDGKSVDDLAGDLAGDLTDNRIDDRSEELRRKVQETRDRLRRRTEGPGGGQA